MEGIAKGDNGSMVKTPEKTKRERCGCRSTCDDQLAGASFTQTNRVRDLDRAVTAGLNLCAGCGARQLLTRGDDPVQPRQLRLANPGEQPPTPTGKGTIGLVSHGKRPLRQKRCARPGTLTCKT